MSGAHCTVTRTKLMSRRHVRVGRHGSSSRCCLGIHWVCIPVPYITIARVCFVGGIRTRSLNAEPVNARAHIDPSCDDIEKHASKKVQVPILQRIISSVIMIYLPMLCKGFQISSTPDVIEAGRTPLVLGTIAIAVAALRIVRPWAM